MPEKRVVVWVQRFKDRTHLMLQWIDPDTGKRKSKSAVTADEKEAEQARADLEADLNHGRYQEASRMSWEAFRDLFEEEYAAGKRPNTRRNYADTFNLFERLCNPGRLRAITERTVSTFAAAMRRLELPSGKVGMEPGTIHVRLEFLHSALAWAVEQKLLPEVPRFPEVTVPRKRPQPVATEAFERMLARAPDDNMRVYLLAGWLAGLRLEEAYCLEWESTEKAPWVDFSRDRIWLPAEFTKGVEDQWVPLDPQLREALEGLPRQGKRVFRFLAADGHEVTSGAVSDRVRRLAKAAGVKLTMKTLRKGFGCRYAGKVSAQVLQKLMRHGDIKTTMAYYANVDDAVEAAVFGPQRNSSRNTPPPADAVPNATADASPSANGTSSEAVSS
jgi:integrase